MVVVLLKLLLVEFVVTTLKIESVILKLFRYFLARRISTIISLLINLLGLTMKWS